MSAALGVALQPRLRWAASISPQLDYSKAPKSITILIVAGFLVEFAYVKDVPFLSNIIFHSGIEYGHYPGIPVFGVLLVTFSVFYATYLIDLSCQSGGRRRHLLLLQFAVIQRGGAHLDDQVDREIDGEHESFRVSRPERGVKEVE
jgi:hypothetical protein